MHSLPCHNVTEYGAVNDGQTLNTSAIQQAIDAAHDEGGGCVYVPPGDWLTGKLRLKDHVRLHLEAGAVLLGSDRLEDYEDAGVDRNENDYCLLTARDATDISIEGHGTIDGQGQTFWVREDKQPNKRKFGWIAAFDYGHPRRPNGRDVNLRLIKLIDCRNVSVKDVTLRNSEFWTLVLLGCVGVGIRGVRFLNPMHGPNTDGVDLEACCDVRISDCEFYTNDDAICIANYEKESHHRPSRNIVVTNCLIVSACNAFKIYGSRGDHENITFSNSVIRAADPDDPLCETAVKTIDPEHFGNALGPIAGICIEAGWRGAVRGVAVSNIVMEQARTPIFLRCSNHGCPREQIGRPDAREPGVMENVIISNVIARGACTASSITGIPAATVHDVTLSEIRIETLGAGEAALAEKEMPEKADWYPDAILWGRLPVYGMYCRHVRGLQMRNVEIVTRHGDERPMMICDDVSGMRLADVRVDPRPHSCELLRLVNVTDAVVQDFIAPAGTRTWIAVHGRETRRIFLRPDLLGGLEQPISFHGEAPVEEVHLRCIFESPKLEA